MGLDVLWWGGIGWEAVEEHGKPGRVVGLALPPALVKRGDTRMPRRVEFVAPRGSQARVLEGESVSIGKWRGGMGWMEYLPKRVRD